MKKFATATTLLVTLIFQACGPSVTFDQPLPENVKSLSSFPQHLQGKYLSSDQVSIVAITASFIARNYDVDYKEHKDSLGASYKIAGDTLINLTEGTKEKIIIKGDTIIGHANWTDTLFNLPGGNILKKFKGYYFLNSRYGNGWGIKELSLKKGVLTIGNISDIEDIQKLKEITETTADTIPRNLKLTNRQFKSFVKQEGFSEQEVFNRIPAK